MLHLCYIALFATAAYIPIYKPQIKVRSPFLVVAATLLVFAVREEVRAFRFLLRTGHGRLNSGNGAVVEWHRNDVATISIENLATGMWIASMDLWLNNHTRAIVKEWLDDLRKSGATVSEYGASHA